jgi:hypothetical protein
MCISRKEKKEVTSPVNDLMHVSIAPRRACFVLNKIWYIHVIVDTYKNKIQHNASYTCMYGQWTYTEITIMPPLTNMYVKISTVVVFDAPRIFPREEHRSRSASR